MYKKQNIDEAKTVSKAMKEDWFKNKNNQLEEFLKLISELQQKMIYPKPQWPLKRKTNSFRLT